MKYNQDEIKVLIAEGRYGEVAKHSEGLVVGLAKKYANNSPLPIEELISAGYYALAKSMKGYDNTKDATFATYATKAIKNEMIQTIRNESNTIRQPYKDNEYQFKANTTDVADINYIDHINVTYQDNDESTLDVLKMCLGDDDYNLLTLYYLDNMTHQEISNKLKITGEGVRIKLKRVIDKIKRDDTLINELKNFLN